MSSSNFFIFFGIIWILIILCCTIPMVVAIVLSEAPLSVLWLLSFFWAIGIIFLAIGIKTRIKDKKTDQYGETVYAKIIDVYFSGVTVNGRQEFKADFLTYISSERKTRVVSEVVGFNPVMYPVNSYVIGKYYNNDINIQEVIGNNVVPGNIREILESPISNMEIENANADDAMHNPISSNITESENDVIDYKNNHW